MDLKFKIIADLKTLEQQLNNLFKKKYKVNVEGDSNSSKKKSSPTGNVKGLIGALKKELKDIGKRKEDATSLKEIKSLNKQQASAQDRLNNLNSKGIKKTGKGVGGLMKALGPLAVLLSLKPVADLLKIITNFIVLGVIGIIKLLKFLGDAIINGWTQLIEGIKFLGNYLKELIPMLWEKIGVWFVQAIDWLKALPGVLWSFISQGFNWLIEKIVNLGSVIGTFFANVGTTIWTALQVGFQWMVDKLTIIWESLVGLAEQLWGFFKGSFEKIGNFVQKLWTGLTTLAGDIWSNIKEGFQIVVDKLGELWGTLKSLPQLIWDKMKELAELIASKIKVFGGGRGESSNNIGGSTAGNDLIMRPDGGVVRTSPQDTLIATKNPSGLGGGGKVMNFYGVTPEEMMQVIRRELATEVNASSRF